MLFKEEVIIVNEPKGRDFFPKRFSNEIYFAQVKSHENIAYRSNYGFKYVVKGQEHYIIDGKHFTVKAGQLLIMPADSEVKTLSFEAHGLSVFIDTELIDEVIGDLTSNDFEYGHKDSVKLGFYPLVTSRAVKIQNPLMNLVKGMKEKNKIQLTPDLYYSMGEQLIGNGSKIKNELELIDRVKYATRLEVYRKLELAHSMIIDLSLEGFSLDRLAQEVGMSKYQLIKYFNQVYGTTPKQLQIQRRMAIAKELLLPRSGVSIDEIAQYLGYHDTAAFSNQYKSLMGHSPSSAK